jgi:hypothetical protein
VAWLHGSMGLSGMTPGSVLTCAVRPVDRHGMNHVLFVPFTGFPYLY